MRCMKFKIIQRVNTFLSGEQSGYNIPEVTPCPDLFTWLSDQYYSEIVNKQDKDLPEHMRRLICDAYICMYQSPSMMRYK